ncbi:S-layer homology domain-containing protein [Paenibacillus sp. MMS18-CY102]|uniref:S-layer homology domain-containing protein n=1 Tax=Paenibacillus sp. MMS18-CY102 TaxID=2682849 RepID=UPI001365C29D|nr:S-layer homology domain-containing protein [Paenibacillus sp. MMS18-CY102]MWC29681.1 hypothetical protein [Paenibacillus sp. MMS18-CY102]
MMDAKRILSCLMIVTLLFSFAVSAGATAQDEANEVNWGTLLPEPTDVKGHWAERLVQWAIMTGVMKGYADHSFKPDQLITEAEFLLALCRPFYNLNEEPNTKDPNYNWTNLPYILASEDNLPALGIPHPKVRNAPITRSRAAKIIAAAQGLNYSGNDAIAYLMGKAK